MVLDVIKVHACDVCGSFIGVHPGDRKSYVGVFYRYYSFSADQTKNNSFFPDGSLRLQHDGHNSTLNVEESYEVYRAFELRTRYYLHPRLEVSVIAPFLMNSSAENNVKSNLSGLGDINLLMGYQMIDDLATGVLKHRLLLGTGIKLPSGDCNKQQNGRRTNILLQPGTGSTDAFLYLNYQIGYDKLSFNFLPMIKLNGTNRYDEKIANSYTLFGSLWYQLEPNENLKVLPSAQAFFEETNGVYIKKELIKGTRMKSLFAGPGVDVFYRNFSWSASCLWNASEASNGSTLESRIRYRTGLTWFFIQNAFVVK